jgi:hypothetical protein
LGNILYEGTENEQRITFIDYLKSKKYDKWSENYKLKKEILHFLKRKGYK